MGGKSKNEAGKNVLIISSSPVNRIVIARSLERLLLRSDASAPDQAVSLLERTHPWLVIIDEQGSESILDNILHRIAQHKRASQDRKTPLALMIARSNEAKAQASQLFDAVLVRPVTPDVLLPAVERLARTA